LTKAWQLVAVGLACAIAYGCGDDDDSAPNNGSAGTAGSQAGAAGENSQAGTSPGGTSSGGHAGTQGNGGSISEAGQAGSNPSMAGQSQGGAAGNGNTALGGAGAAAGGVGGAGGDAGAGGGPSAKQVQKICADYAAFYKKVAQATTCVDVSAGVKSTCLQGYATSTCVDEAAAYFGCAKDRPDTDFQCVAGTVSAKPGICTAEQAAYIACVNQ